MLVAILTASSGPDRELFRLYSVQTTSSAVVVGTSAISFNVHVNFVTYTVP